MGTFKNHFYKVISNRVDRQLNEIDRICKEIGYDNHDWFSKQKGAFNGTTSDFLDDLIISFVYKLDREICKLLLNYFEPDGNNYLNEPYILFNLELDHSYERGIYVEHDYNKKAFVEKLNELTLKQKQELMNNRIFSYIINQTNTKIFSKKDMRKIKIDNINESSRDNKG